MQGYRGGEESEIIIRLIMGAQVHHRCKSTGETFTEAGWRKWLKSHDPSNAVTEYKEFGYDINDVCLTPRKPVEWHNRYCAITITTSQSPCGAWDYGFFWKIVENSSFGAPLFIPEDEIANGYRSEKFAISGCLKKIRKIFSDDLRWRKEIGDDYDEFGNWEENTAIIPYIEKAMAQIDALIDRFDPRQLDLFD